MKINSQPQQQSDNVTNELVSYGKIVTNHNLTRTSFHEVVQQIKTGSGGLIKKIEAVRAITDSDTRQEQKRITLPYFNMGTFKGDIRKDVNLEQIRYFTFDIDHIGDKAALEQKKNQLFAESFIYAAFVSPSGDGVKFICKIAKAITAAAEYKTAYTYYLHKFKEQFGCTFDHTIDPSRPCFLSYDPEIYVNTDSVPLPVILPTNGQQKQNVPTVTDPLAVLLSIGTTPGNRTHAMTQILGHLIKQGYSQQSAEQIVLMWNDKNNPPHTRGKIVETVADLYERYKSKDNRLPMTIFERDGSYYKVVMRNNVPHDVQFTTFTMQPKELLVLKDSDVLNCTVTTNEGMVYEDVHIDNPDWHSKGKLLKAIGHQDCTFVGQENDIQGLCGYVNTQDIVRKTGTKVVGLHEYNTWVTEDMNITSAGMTSQMSVIPYVKGSDAFYKNIRYAPCSSAEYTTLVSGLYTNLAEVNDATTILPWIAWTFATPVKPIVQKQLGGFPLAFVHGVQGGGKTSTAKMFARLCGYIDSNPKSCTQRSFPLLVTLSATNSIPVFLDEYKESDMRDDQIENLQRYMRRVYSGEVEAKGRADQTVENYKLDAPLCVMGEWSVNQPALRERIILVQFNDSVKKNKKMREAFEAVKSLQLEAFMPEYIQFCLNLDVLSLLKTAQDIVEKHFQSITVAPRIKDNLAVMVMGLEMYRVFGEQMKLKVQPIDIAELLNHELKAITGTDGGFVRSAVDQLIEEFAVMAQNGKVKKEDDFRVTQIDIADPTSPDILAIRFTKVYPEFKIHAKQTGYEGDQLDKKSYLGLFSQCEYVLEKDQVVRFQDDKRHRCLVIHVQKAKSAGLDLEGFGIA